MDWRKMLGRGVGQGEFEPLSPAHAAYLRDLVQRAGKIDKNRQVFGAGSHQYRLNPVIAPEEVRRFEAQYRVNLPREYVFFLTEVGNGGAGPYYGLYPLEKLAMYTECLGRYTQEEAENLPAFIDRKMTDRDWAAAVGEDGDDQAYEDMMKQVCSGLLVIGTQGCTYDNLLMWKGSERGKIVYIDWNMEPEYGPFFTGLTFLDWYQRYFEELIAGNSVTSYGYRSLKTEWELVEKYPAAATDRERREILTGLFRFPRVEPSTVDFLAGLREPGIDGLRTELLFKFDLSRGLGVFEELLGGRNPDGAVSCARRMPEQCKERYYRDMLRLLYEPGVRDKSRVLFFLSDCGSCAARDIAAFAAEPENGEESRKIAVYVMGRCADKTDFLPLFIELMQGPSYWLAHTALQAVAKTPCKELLKTYEWMWEAYRDDKMIRSNLRAAFEAQGIKKQ